MQTIVTDVRGGCLSVHTSVCSSISLSRGSTRLYCAKTAERIKIPFGLNTLRGLRNIVLDGGPDPPRRWGGGFDATFAKLLWPLVCVYCANVANCANFIVLITLAAFYAKKCSHYYPQHQQVIEYFNMPKCDYFEERNIRRVSVLYW